MSKNNEPHYLYRFRAWDKNVYYGNLDVSNLTTEMVEDGWGEWEWIDEQKYEEILRYIGWENPCHYQAQKLLVDIHEDTSFCPKRWIADSYAARLAAQAQKGRTA
jgi:hypothetical protein